MMHVLDHEQEQINYSFKLYYKLGVLQNSSYTHTITKGGSWQ